jgi:hypothetical protein
MIPRRDIEGPVLLPFLEEKVWQMGEGSALSRDLYGIEMDESGWGIALLAIWFNCDRTDQPLSTRHNHAP